MNKAAFSRHPSLVTGAFLGGLTSLPLIALSYLGGRLASLPFVPFDLFDWFARVLPGHLVTTGVDLIVTSVRFVGVDRIDVAAKYVEESIGVVLVIVAAVLVGFVVALVLRRSRWRGSSVGAVAGLIVFLFVGGFEIDLGGSISQRPVPALLWLAVLVIGWGALLGKWIGAAAVGEDIASTSPQSRSGRRAFLVKLSTGSVGVALAALGVGRLFEQPGNRTSAAGSPLRGLRGSATAAQSSTVRDRVPPAPGTRPELTPNKDFYRIDIDTRPPTIDQESWRLRVGGLFDRPRTLTYSDILAYPPVTQPITLCCISNPVGGDLISTSNWMGVPLRLVLQDLGLQPGAKALFIKAEDGFFESVAMDDMMDPRTLLVYGMNGDALPVSHGFPLRIYIPNRYGMKQPKWITSIEATDKVKPGYWEERGWSQQAYPRIVSVIDTAGTGHIQNDRVPVGGIAWAGDRGIRKVEIQVDEGPWVVAIQRTPPLGPLTWVQWRYDWPIEHGSHTFRVRAIDGTGAMQIGQNHNPFPAGATGYDSVTVTI